MHLSERNRLENQKRALVLGSSDMAQVVAAARALKTETDLDLSRALETAIVVSFMRPFSGTLDLPPDYGEPDVPEVIALLDYFKGLRDQVYAHTDKTGPRQSGTISIGTADGDVVNVVFTEEWIPLPRGILDEIIFTADQLKENMRLDAAKAQVILNGELPLSQWGTL